jgi:hypothetical protein
VTAAAPAHAAVASYPQFSMMTAHSWGEYWAGDQVAGKWGWDPKSPTESRISWGDPEPWPPDYAEKFIIGTSWVLLDGWYGNGTYYTVRVSTEQLGDANCNNLHTLASDGGRQHYVALVVTGTAYCLKAWGTITEESSGRVVDFGHTQIWYPPSTCSNPYYGTRTCIKQWESWWDNKGAPGTPITRKVDRDQYIARGIGMAFQIQQYYPSPWHADLRYNGVS